MSVSTTSKIIEDAKKNTPSLKTLPTIVCEVMKNPFSWYKSNTLCQQSSRGKKVSYQVNLIPVPSPGQLQAADIFQEPVSE
jgi:hypothetical protein